jgi:cytochrome c oxidase assembly protein subunit 11
MKAMDQEAQKTVLARRNRRTGLAAAGVVTFMVGLSFAAVPLYDLFCRVTGYGGTTQRSAAAPGADGLAASGLVGGARVTTDCAASTA